MRERPRYLSYLLRLWQSGSGQDAHWRASLESPLTGERLGFGTLDRLVGFLDDQLGKAESGTQEGGMIQASPDNPASEVP